MKNKEFEKILKRRIKLTCDVLANKNAEYATNNDKLHNFKRAGTMLGCTSERALIGMKAKHDVSVLDIVDKLNSNELPSEKLLEEKIGDSINYLILLEALIKERLRKVKK